MKTIPLPNDQFAKVDDADFERLAQHKWFAKRGHRGIYVVANLRNEYGMWYQMTMGRFLLDPSPSERVIYLDRDGLNCQRDNLRISTRSEALLYHRRHYDFPTGIDGITMTASGQYRVRLLNAKGTAILFRVCNSFSEAKEALDSELRYRANVESILAEKLPHRLALPAARTPDTSSFFEQSAECTIPSGGCGDDFFAA